MTIGFPKPERKVDEALLEKVRAMSCAVCGAPGPSDPSHIRTRGAGGDDFDFNVFPKCRKHHQEWHQGWFRFLLRHPSFRELMIAAGWRVEFFDRQRPYLRHPRFE